MLRNPRCVAVSQKNLNTNIRINTGEKFESVKKIFAADPHRFVDDVGSFYKWLRSNPDMKQRVLLVTYDDMLTNTSEQIDRVIAHLGISVTEEQRERAVSNVDQGLYRSKSLEWEPVHSACGEIADSLYAAILEDSEEVFGSIEAYGKETFKEQIRWVDSHEFESWRIMTPALYRSFKTNNKGLRDKLMKGSHLRKHQNTCPSFGISNTEYTIERPSDMGNLVRKKILCKGTEKTYEQCFGCWRRDGN